MISVDQLLAEARSWLGTPYQHQGRTKFGVDCIGYVMCVYHSLNPWPHVMRETRTYGMRPTDGLLLAKVSKYCTQVHKAEPGVVILIQWPKASTPSHAAICGGSTILHSYKRAGRAVETSYGEPWLRTTHSFWRLPGVKYV